MPKFNKSTETRLDILNGGNWPDKFNGKPRNRRIYIGAVAGSRRKASAGSHERYDYHRQYYLQNKEKIAEHKRNYLARNREKVADYWRRYRNQNTHRVSEYQRSYRAKHKLRLKYKRCGIDPGTGLGPDATL